MGSGTIESFFYYCMIDIVKCHEKNNVVLQLRVRLNFHNPFFYFEIQLSSCVG